MLFAGKVEVVEEYDEDIRSVSITVKMPAVVRLLNHIRWHRHAVKFSRVNVLTRDHFSCQYCGCKPVIKELTFDHVLPKSQGGSTCWENIVTACRRCNSKKGSRTPDQARMRLRSQPCRPRDLPFLQLHVRLGRSIPEAWKSWVWWQGSLDKQVI